MDFCDVLKKYKEYLELRRTLKRAIRMQLAQMGYYYSRVRIDSNYIELNLTEELTKHEIHLLEKKFKIKMTLRDQHIIVNINEPLYFLSAEFGGSEVFIYRFRGDYNGD